MTNTLWNSVCDTLKTDVGEQSFNSWIAPLSFSPEHSTPNSATLVVPSGFMRNWVERHYADTIASAFKSAAGTDIEITYVLKGEMGTTPQAQATSTPSAAQATGALANVAAPTSLAGQKDSMHQGTPLDPRFTFDRYVTGKSNEFAFAAAKRISETDDTQYNPFILYGGVGLGKTHLMQAIAWEKKRLNPNINIVYVSAEKFVNMFVSALRNKKNMEPFEKMFRNADLLMVDDIQFIAGKEQSQEKFFHTFNSLMDSRKQIVFTADKPPAELDGIEDRLRSRFAWGLTTAIHKPSLETRIAILEEKAQSLSVDLKRDVAHFLAEKIDSNVRELEGALNRLIAHTQLVQKDITIETTQEILHDIFKSYEKTVTIDDIQRKVTDHFNIKMSELLGTRRSRAVARPRQIAMFLAKNCTTKSYPDIGRAFGGRDHTTVMHAVKTVEKLIDTDPAVKEDVKLLEKILTTSV